MSRRSFVHASRVPAPVDEVYRWHLRPGALRRMVPPWESVEAADVPVAPGSVVELSTRVGPLRARWVAEHTDVQEGRLFRDVQRSGPFAEWEHVHRFEPAGPEACRLSDEIAYALPGGAVGDALAGGWVSRRLERTFRWRHATLAADLEQHARAERGRTLRWAVTGAGGLVGSSLVPFLRTGGHELVRLVRRAPAGPDEARWNPERSEPLTPDLEGLDVVVHLAGESIARRWTEARKRAIRDSRVDGTRNLCRSLARLDAPPSTLVVASAVGAYGDRGDERLDDTSPRGEGFLADVAREWEAAADPAREAGVRVVHLRFGVILDPRGGALAKLLVPFRLGVGGRVGSGAQWMSWISVDDAVAAVHEVAVRPDHTGPRNAVAPEPVTNAVFTRVLGRVLRRPAVVPLPAPAARAALGEMADELLLAGQRAHPDALLAGGFRFRHPDLETALRALLGRSL